MKIMKINAVNTSLYLSFKQVKYVFAKQLYLLITIKTLLLIHNNTFKKKTLQNLPYPCACAEIVMSIFFLNSSKSLAFVGRDKIPRHASGSGRLFSVLLNLM